MEEEASEEKGTIIVKKVKKVRHAAEHGGSWKVAYADFVTAMMAFFLLLWLVSTIPQETKNGLAGFMKNYSLLKPSGASVVQKGPSPYGEDVMEKSKDAARDGGKSREEAADMLINEMETALGQLRDHAIFEIVDGKLRVNLVDKEGSPIFPSGETRPNAMGKELLRLTAETVKKTNYRVVVEGHTDAHPIAGGDLSNWDLSTLRASSARRELENNGIRKMMFERVVGYADTMPMIKDNPYDPRNRRISLLLLD